MSWRLKSAASPIAVCLVVAIAQTILVTEAKAGEIPTRKGGLWEQKTTMDQGNGPQDHTLTICIDDGMEKQTAAASLKQHKENCAKYEIKSTDGKTEVQAECVFNKRPVKSTTKMTGDFESNFNIKIESRTTLEDGGQSRILTRKINQIGKYLGDDCGELKPGEAMGSNGDKIMVQ